MIKKAFTEPIEDSGVVGAVDVARAYLEAEIAKHPEKAESTLDDCNTEEDLFELLHHYSRIVRSNKVYESVMNEDYFWELIDVPVEEVFMGQINPRTNIVLEQVNYNLVAFTRYLRTYFKKWPDSDPEGLGEFRPDPERPLEYETVIALDKGKITLIDANHRAVQMVMREDKTIRTYYGCKIK